MYDVCIVGAGVAGLCAAISAGRCGKKVLLLDKNKKTGRKLYATGNGRCNVSNEYMELDRVFYSGSYNYIEFLRHVLGVDPTNEVISFLRSIGIDTVANERSYIYPSSQQASSVVWALQDEANRLLVEIILEETVLEIHKKDENFSLVCSHNNYTAREVILACGSLSCAKLGGTDSGYELAKKLGHTINKIRPSLCGLITNAPSMELSGVRAICNVTLKCEDEAIKSEVGEVQFTEYGLSGIVVFNLSSLAGKFLYEGRQARICLNPLFRYSYKDFNSILEGSSQRSCLGALNGMLNDRLASYILGELGIEKRRLVSDISDTEIKNIYEYTRNITFEAKNLNGYENAQTVAGGIALTEINASDLSSKLVEGLYFAGEIADIDGICGGYNITYAIISGLKAGRGTKC